MAQLQIVYLLRPGTQERWRRLCQELAGSRRGRFAASCQQEQFQVLLGWNVQEVLPDLQGDLIFTWPDESFHPK
jgi:hypothetical protein